jgi:hypothetical protein
MNLGRGLDGAVYVRVAENLPANLHASLVRGRRS